MRKFISLHGTTQEARIAEWKAMTYADRLQTVHILNFWEELAGRYNRKQVDQEIVRDYFGAGACLVWDDGKWFATYQREKNPRAMEQLEKMCADVRRHRQANIQ